VKLGILNGIESETAFHCHAEPNASLKLVVISIVSPRCPAWDGFSSQHIGGGLEGNCRLETMTATGLFLLRLSVASGCAKYNLPD
jgi:hypothetical protein